MALGLCCQWLVTKNNKPKNILVSRSLQLGRFNRGEYTHDRIRQTYVDNLQNLLDVLPTVIDSGIRSMRVSSSMFPLFDKIDRDLYDNKTVVGLLKLIGAMALKHNVRLTTHPGQFTVLSSDNPDTVNNSIREVEHHAWLFDQMGLDQSPYYSINVHGGKGDRAEQLTTAINRLSASAKSRLTLENCEFAYSVNDLLPVSQATGVPICFDSHHHKFNADGVLGEDAMSAAIATWPSGVRPLTHVSNSKPDYPTTAPATKLRQHSDYLYTIPEYQHKLNDSGSIDIDVEAKRKNLAIFKAAAELDIRVS